MLRVRQEIRQPVTSLWQTATERAEAAPTRLVSHGGGMVDCTNTTARRDLSRCQRQSQSSSARAKVGVGLSTPPAGATNTTGGAGHGSPNGDGGKGSKVRGRAPREDDPGNATVLTAPVGGPGGGVVDGDQRGRRKTPIPLRSSHRVGPIGSLGERSAHASENKHDARSASPVGGVCVCNKGCVWSSTPTATVTHRERGRLSHSAVFTMYFVCVQ